MQSHPPDRARGAASSAHPARPRSLKICIWYEAVGILVQNSDRLMPHKIILLCPTHQPEFVRVGQTGVVRSHAHTIDERPVAIRREAHAIALATIGQFLTRLHRDDDWVAHAPVV